MKESKKYTKQELLNKELSTLRKIKNETKSIHEYWKIEQTVPIRSKEKFNDLKNQSIKNREKYSQEAQKIRKKINSIEQQSPTLYK